MAREMNWMGKTEEDLKKMEMKEFMALVPSRTRRSLERGFTEQQKRLLKRVTVNAPNIKTHCRDMIIVPVMLGKTLKIHNGKEFHPVLVTTEMLGHYLGEFVMTRKPVTHSAAGIGATRSSKAISAR